MVFQRLLGSKIDHDDAQVRAKAFAQEDIAQEVFSERLKSESDADVLCAILARSEDVEAIIHHAESSTTASIVNQARARLLSLASVPVDTTPSVWSSLYLTAQNSSWPQMAALTDLVSSDVGMENIVQGALDARQKNRAVALSQATLKSLVIHSQSAPIRLQAANLLEDAEAIQACSAYSKESDKAVYRVIKEKLDVIHRIRDHETQAEQLIQDCEELCAHEFAAQTESIAQGRSKLQKLEDQVNILTSDDIIFSNKAHLATIFDQCKTRVEQSLEDKKKLALARRALLDEMSERIDPAEQAGEPSLAPAEAISDIYLADCHQRWSGIPDHSESDVKQFESKLDQLQAKFKQIQKSQTESEKLEKVMESWRLRIDQGDPEKLLKNIESQWHKLSEQVSSTTLATQQEVYEQLTSKVKGRISNLQNTRKQNQDQLQKMQSELVDCIESGDLKKAIPIHDRLKSRLAKAEISSDFRADVDSQLKVIQPKLEEFRKWRHFGTQQARETLLGQANNLLANPPASPKVLASEVKKLRESWRELDRDDGRASEPQWQAFHSVCKEAYKPAKKHFTSLSKERKGNAREKHAINEELNALYEATDWEAPNWTEVTASFKELSLRWRKTGSVDYKLKADIEQQHKELINKFEKTLGAERDAEVKRRQDIITQLKKQFEEEDLSIAISSAKRLQRQWKPTVQSDRKQEQLLWNEFRQVCDLIFSSLKEKNQAQKSAWQADASKRDKLCEELDGLLLGEENQTSINLAKGSATKITQAWREPSEIPKPVFLKLDKKFRVARKQFESRLKLAQQKQQRAQAEQLIALNEICIRIESAVIDGAQGSLDAEALASEWSAFGELSGTSAKALTKRFELGQQALAGEEHGEIQIKQAAANNLQERLSLCLRGELLSDVDTPAEYHSDRKTLQMSRLKDAMQGSIPPADQELKQIIDRWLSLGGVDGNSWKALRERFHNVLKAASEK